ncbi:hypothetical protein [Pukyongiella litopenaei]|uniref:Uncharacterized protein n=1 Tax=Pukyongiella litopenaei TaxID=2605946 RepID=A0A2S0MNA5_9RHOB|nr:hypothetical protein [Pukyongiella litopenaei]AVO37369.1 hypothetical protein C6Y53_06360 [Pukyongiella litopenaei]
MRAAGFPMRHPRVRVGGVTGDSCDRKRVAVRIENEDGSYHGHLSFAIEDLDTLNDMVADFAPTLARLWEQRGA